MNLPCFGSVDLSMQVCSLLKKELNNDGILFQFLLKKNLKIVNINDIKTKKQAKEQESKPWKVHTQDKTNQLTTNKSYISYSIFTRRLKSTYCLYNIEQWYSWILLVEVWYMLLFFQLGLLSNFEAIGNQPQLSFCTMNHHQHKNLIHKDTKKHETNLLSPNHHKNKQTNKQTNKPTNQPTNPKHTKTQYKRPSIAAC